MAGTLFVAVLPGALWGAYELIRWSVPTEPPKGLEDAQKEKLKSLSQSLSEGTSKPIESLQDPLPPGSPVFDEYLIFVTFSFFLSFFSSSFI